MKISRNSLIFSLIYLAVRSCQSSAEKLSIDANLRYEAQEFDAIAREDISAFSPKERGRLARIDADLSAFDQDLKDFLKNLEESRNREDPEERVTSLRRDVRDLEQIVQVLRDIIKNRPNQGLAQPSCDTSNLYCDRNALDSLLLRIDEINKKAIDVLRFNRENPKDPRKFLGLQGFEEACDFGKLLIVLKDCVINPSCI